MEKLATKITINTRLTKYGVDMVPEKDLPDEVVEKRFVLEGKEAKKVLDQISDGDTKLTLTAVVEK